MDDTRPYSKSKLKLNLKKVELEKPKICLSAFVSFLHEKPNFRYSSLSFVRLS